MIDEQRTVASLVLDHPAYAEVFTRHRIDYCCRGNTPLAKAAAERALALPVLVAELEAASAARATDDALDARTLATPALLDHIVAKHHVYLRTALPFLSKLATKVNRVHGDADLRLREVLRIVLALESALLPHLDMEEEDLFPAMRNGEGALLSVQLAEMNTDHLAVGELLEALRRVTSDFSLPDFACGSYKTLFSELATLESDILTHVHLENHVLMPRFSAS